MNDQVFKRVETLAKEVKQDLRKKGLVVPRDNGDGTITVDRYTIVKGKTGFYSILDHHNDTIIDGINLAQTAAVIANSLALGRWIDTDIVKQDKQYGFNLFEEELSKKHAEDSLKKHNIDRAEVMYTKLNIARQKKLSAKAYIVSSFEKLRRLR
jgi:hypothetical protein